MQEVTNNFFNRFQQSNKYKLSDTNSNYINFLRAVSSQIVVIGHVLYLNKLLTDSSIMKSLPSFSVMIFFVLSGFVIAFSTYTKGTGYSFKNYLIDRFSRIYITLIPALAFTLIIALMSYLYQGYFPFEINLKFLISNILMQQENLFLLRIQYILPNTSGYKFIGFFGDNLPLWSLSIEWWHYIFFGLMFYKKIKDFEIKHYILFFISVLFVVGYAIFPGRASNGLSFIWFSGVLINFLLSSNLKIRYSGFWSIAFLLFTVVSYKINSSISILFFIIFFASCLIYFQSNNNKILNVFFLLFKWPSNYSFSLYIIHYPILLVALNYIKSPIWNCALVFVISNILGLLFYLLFETKYKNIAIKLKQKLQ